MTKGKQVSKSSYWGIFIVLFIIYQLIKIGVSNDWFVNKQKNNLKDNQLGGDICKTLSVSKSECKNLIKKLEELKLEDNENTILSTEAVPHKN